MLEKCRVLREYTLFVEKVRELKAMGEPDYMKKAIEYCIEHHILEEYLRRKGSDVVGFLCAEYDYEMDMQVKGEEKYEEGYEAGEIAGRAEGFAAGEAKGFAAGEAKGFAAGEAAGKAESILELLKDIGTVSKEMENEIMGQDDLDILKEWLKLAARASSIEEFEQQIKNTKE